MPVETSGSTTYIASEIMTGIYLGTRAKTGATAIALRPS